MSRKVAGCCGGQLELKALIFSRKDYTKRLYNKMIMKLYPHIAQPQEMTTPISKNDFQWDGLGESKL